MFTNRKYYFNWKVNQIFSTVCISCTTECVRQVVTPLYTEFLFLMPIYKKFYKIYRTTTLFKFLEKVSNDLICQKPY